VKKLREECGVFGVSLTADEAVGIVYNGLLSLQHRGQEGAGIATIKDNHIKCHKDVGLVTEIFPQKLPNMMKSKVAIGHATYSHEDVAMRDNTGPFVREYLTGRIVVSHNGFIRNSEEIKERLKALGVYFKSTSDGEVVAASIGYHVSNEKDLIKGIVKACNEFIGAFSLIVACGDGRIVAVRDAVGFRPLCVGKSKNGVAVASESCALDATGFEILDDVLPGEVVLIENAKIVSREKLINTINVADRMHGLCAFEYVYFARPDSFVDGLSVNQARFEMGKALAKSAPVEADFVVGIPDSGLEAAIGYSQGSGISLATGFIKNRYVGRSFIYPTQEQREGIVKVKLNPLKNIITGKRVVLVDDSIVRGTTISHIIKCVRQAGAKEVHVRVSSPPFIYRCDYGTKIGDEKSLIARNLTAQQINKKIGADSLGFLSVDDLKEVCKGNTKQLCMACFAGYGEDKK